MNNFECKLSRKNNMVRINFNQTVSKGSIFYKDFKDDIYKKLFNFVNKDFVEFKDPKPENRTFYKIVTPSSEFEIAERVLPLKNFYNFRDIGGYKTKDGRRVKYGIFYRSEDLHNLKGEDLDYFKTLDIKTIFDYRSSDEVKSNPDVLLSGIKYYNLSGIQTLNNNLDMFTSIKNAIKNNKLDSVVDYLIDGYKSMPLNNNAYKTLIESIKNKDNTPLLQHCTAGKDRTGFGSALILLLLGVDMKDVMSDYLLTNDCTKNHLKVLEEKFDPKSFNLNLTSDQMKEIKGLLGVKKEFIKSSFDIIMKKYGSFESYFKEEFSLKSEDIENIKDLYLE